MILGPLLKLGGMFILFNEVRGLILAAPVFYGMYQAGGSWMAIWLGICSLGGIALSVVVPWFAAKKLQKVVERKQAQLQPAMA